MFRIFWLAGLKNYVKAKEALLVRKGTKWNIKEFAKQCQVQVIDLSRITELERNFKISGTDWPWFSDINFVISDQAREEIKKKGVINTENFHQIPFFRI